MTDICPTRISLKVGEETPSNRLKIIANEIKGGKVFLTDKSLHTAKKDHRLWAWLKAVIGLIGVKLERTDPERAIKSLGEYLTKNEAIFFSGAKISAEEAQKNLQNFKDIFDTLLPPKTRKKTNPETFKACIAILEKYKKKSEKAEPTEKLANSTKEAEQEPQGAKAQVANLDSKKVQQGLKNTQLEDVPNATVKAAPFQPQQAQDMPAEKVQDEPGKAQEEAEEQELLERQKELIEQAELLKKQEEELIEQEEKLKEEEEELQSERETIEVGDELDPLKEQQTSEVSQTLRQDEPEATISEEHLDEVLPQTEQTLAEGETDEATAQEVDESTNTALSNQNTEIKNLEEENSKNQPQVSASENKKKKSRNGSERRHRRKSNRI